MILSIMSFLIPENLKNVEHGFQSALPVKGKWKAFDTFISGSKLRVLYKLKIDI